MPRRTKIIATIGPASESREVLEKLIHAGMNLTRMNFSHGTHEGYARCISQVRDISEHLGIPVGILQDLQGPKIRVGTFAKGSVALEPGAVLVLLNEALVVGQGRLERVEADRAVLDGRVHVVGPPR